MTDWKNCIGNLYVTYAYEDDVDPRIVKMLDIYEFFFDDAFWYWRPNPKGRHKAQRRARTKSGDSSRIIKRSPLWTYPVKSVPTEHPKDPLQSKLEFLEVEQNV